MKTIMKKIIFIYSILSAFSFSTHLTAADKADFSLAPVVEYANEISLLSPRLDKILTKDYPIYPAKLKLFMPTFNPKDLGLTEFEFTYFPNKQQIATYETLVEKIDKLIETHDTSLQVNHYFFKANLLHAIANANLGGEDEYHGVLAKNAYIEALTLFPNAQEALLGTYHLCTLLIKLKEFQDVFYLANRQEETWSSSKEWAAAFRSVMMESYIQRKRFIHAEDFFWLLAAKMNQEDLTPDLALRYGDALFMQQEFKKAADWYKSVPQFLSSQDSSIAKYSKLYFAESLYQTQNFSESLVAFNEIAEQNFHPSVKDYIQFRLLQLGAKNNGNELEYEDKLRNFSPKDPSTNLQDAITLQWSRLLLRLKQEHLYSDAIEKTEKIISVQDSKNFKDEALFLQGILKWNSNQKQEALEQLASLSKNTWLDDEHDPLVDEYGNQVVELLLQDQDELKSKSNYAEILREADNFKKAIDVAPDTENKIKMLIHTANAFTETHFLSSSSRLLQRLLFEYDLKPELKTETILELGRNYALMGEFDLLAQVLSYVRDLPNSERAQKLFLLNQAALALSQGNYLQCSQSFEHLIKTKLSAYELYKYAVQGSTCARYSHSLEQAQHFLALLPNDSNVWEESSDSSTPSSEQMAMADLQKQAYFERISLQVALNKNTDSVDEYEQRRAFFKPNEIPLDTVFQLLKAYQRNGQNDAAMDLWKAYTENSKANWVAMLNPEFPQLLNLFGELDLIPRS